MNNTMTKEQRDDFDLSRGMAEYRVKLVSIQSELKDIKEKIERAYVLNDNLSFDKLMQRQRELETQRDALLYGTTQEEFNRLADQGDFYKTEKYGSESGKRAAKNKKDRREVTPLTEDESILQSFRTAEGIIGTLDAINAKIELTNNADDVIRLKKKKARLLGEEDF